MAIIYSKISDAVASLYGNDTNLPTATDSAVLYAKNNHLYQIAKADVKKYKEFRTKEGCIYARNSGDANLPDTQINIWVKKTTENTYVLAVGKEKKSDVDISLDTGISLSAKPLTYNDTSKTEITVSDNKANVVNGEVVLNFTYTSGLTVKLFVNGVDTEFTDSSRTCSAVLDIEEDTVIEIKSVDA